jgi:hypothetical protein
MSTGNWVPVVDGGSGIKLWGRAVGKFACGHLFRSSKPAETNLTLFEGKKEGVTEGTTSSGVASNFHVCCGLDPRPIKDGKPREAETTVIARSAQHI